MSNDVKVVLTTTQEKYGKGGATVSLPPHEAKDLVRVGLAAFKTEPKSDAPASQKKEG